MLHDTGMRFRPPVSAEAHDLADVVSRRPALDNEPGLVPGIAVPGQAKLATVRLLHPCARDTSEKIQDHQEPDRCQYRRPAPDSVAAHSVTKG